jgi:hypothetical protein
MGKIEAAKVGKTSVKMWKFESENAKAQGNSLGLHTLKPDDYSPALFRK